MSSMTIDDARAARVAEIRRWLGPPVWEHSSVLLYGGDCLGLMRRLPAELVDLTVTSQPYNIGKEYEHPLETSAYLDWCELWLDEIFRLTTPSGAFWLNLGYTSLEGRAKAIPIIYLLWSRIKFYLVQEIIWNYGAGVAARRMFSPRNEKWLWYVKDPASYTFNLDEVRDPQVRYPNQKKNGRIRVNPIGKNPTDVWQIPKVTTGAGRTGQRASPERTAHPAQFPEAVVKRIVLACSNPGELVMDPFGGSGTTAAIAMASGRACLSFELSADYLQVAVRRLQRLARTLEVERLPLFKI
jgi:adenine-specific DNA-methyltransferase